MKAPNHGMRVRVMFGGVPRYGYLAYTPDDRSFQGFDGLAPSGLSLVGDDLLPYGLWSSDRIEMVPMSEWGRWLSAAELDALPDLSIVRIAATPLYARTKVVMADGSTLWWISGTDWLLAADTSEQLALLGPHVILYRPDRDQP